ncbi:hypothetical protein DVH05_023463 [Phytophthora capsici]|nr:hypothetical protein DVH05_023463 [Phytophthora capsici]
MALDERVDTLMFLQAVAEMEYGKKITDVGQKTNQIILLPLYIDNNHWCGEIFDYRSERRGVLVFDPLQDPKSKYYAKCEELLKDVFLEGEDSSISLPIQRVTNVRQPDISSCGAAL